MTKEEFEVASRIKSRLDRNERILSRIQSEVGKNALVDAFGLNRYNDHALITFCCNCATEYLKEINMGIKRELDQMFSDD